MTKWENRDRKIKKKRASKKLSKPFRRFEKGESINKRATKLRFRLARRAKEDLYNTDVDVEE